MNEMLLIVIVFVAMYFMIIAPQKKRFKEMQEMVAALKKGDHVIVSGGLHGIIEEINESTIVLDCEGIYLTFERYAVSRVVDTDVVGTTYENVKEDVEQEETDSQDVTEEIVSEVAVEDIVTNLDDNE
ncbi:MULTISPECIES: preprotein translocase subunit YajC [unclassified Granulicatella]|uniref:preprotein translocase subunit YajC n=1 Tax=unclassified Granulicatella TaxID=2630493 RepID=UPI001073E4DD|nr:MULTISPECIES: preprotein translocase subunit YajC [unclassified Granulicatella]MBF0780967.1 preprotein translocase subunit YajC [Granulicatella sp. 19428wC4_WM01]TFU92965.1 preprotein translocase subunit YajC [Granulicatella sp. WM01]